MEKYIQIMAIYYVINFVFVLTYCIMEKINLERKVYCYHPAKYRKCLFLGHRTVSITKVASSPSPSPFHIFHCWCFSRVFVFVHHPCHAINLAAFSRSPFCLFQLPPPLRDYAVPLFTNRFIIFAYTKRIKKKIAGCCWCCL